MSDSGVPAMVSATMLFEKAPHVIVVLDPGLMILDVNEAGSRFLGVEPARANGLPLFDLLPQAAAAGSAWQALLRQSYAQVLVDGGTQVSIVLLLRDGLTPDSRPAAQSSTDGGLWHVCHVPLHDQRGNLIAIATHALLLEGIEIANAKTPFRMAAQTATPCAASARQLAVPAQGGGHDMPAPTDADAAVHHGLDGTAQIDGRGGTGAGMGAVPGDGLRILMVEDNDDLRRLNVEQLETLGHSVTSTVDAEQALRHLETTTFDLLFTDLTLPKMTGAELARIVLQQHHPIRVVITSGYGRAMANAQSLDALFLPKPYRFADLEEVLRQARLRRDR